MSQIRPVDAIADGAESAAVSDGEPPFVQRRVTVALAKRALLLLVIPACAVALGLWAYLETGRIESTENAYVKSHIINVSPEVAGTIVQVAVEENQRVEQGALLLTLDDRPYKLALQGAEARRAEVETDIAADKQGYLSALSEIDLHKSTVAYARSQLVRQQTLFDRELGRDEDLDTARYDLESAQRRVSIAQQQAATLLAKLNGDADIEPRRHPAWQAAQMEVEQARLDLERTNIYAPVTGIIAKRPEPGAYVFTFMPVIAVVAEDDIWIEANFKETQMTHMRAGQTVEVTVDAYPGERWHGVVESISRSTGAEFAMLPPQNATGNWVKIVQRVPVRIRLQAAHPDLVLRAGMSCEVDVDTGYERQWRDLIAGW